MIANSNAGLKMVTTIDKIREKTSGAFFSVKSREIQSNFSVTFESFKSMVKLKEFASAVMKAL